MGLLQKAKEFISTKSKRTTAFLEREGELRTKIAELEAQKSKLVSEYDPLKPFDAKHIEKIDTDISMLRKEMEVLQESKAQTPAHDVDEAIKHIEGAKQEANELISKKEEEADKAREKIAEAKTALLKAQAEHYNVLRKAEELKNDVNETIGQLSTSIDRKIRQLENQLHQVERELYTLAPNSQFQAINGSQSQIDVLQEKSSALKREIYELREHLKPVGVGIPNLENFRDPNGSTIYFVHSKEQQDASKRGILPK